MVKKLSTPRVRNSGLQQQQNYEELITPLASVNNVEIESANLDELGAILETANQAVSKHLMSALQAALIAGRALLAARKLFVYDRDMGGFRGWVEEKGISRPTAYRYIKLAEHIEIVSQAETLSEAQALISKHKADQLTTKRESESNYKQLRTTLKLQQDRYNKLEVIAANKGIDCSDLITEVLERWLGRQKIEEIIDINMEK